MACGNPINYSPGSAQCQNAAKNSALWTLCKFVQTQGYGCPGGFNIGISVRECTYQ